MQEKKVDINLSKFPQKLPKKLQKHYWNVATSKRKSILNRMDSLIDFFMT